MKFDIAALLFAMVLVLAGSATGQETTYLSLKARIPLPNVKGRIDHFAVDVKGQRLFMAGVGNHTLEVIDLQSNKRVRRGCITMQPPIASMSPAAWTASRKSMMGRRLSLSEA
jgi:hypothetical protein